MDYYYQRDRCPELDGEDRIIDTTSSNIRKFFRGTNIFVTGGAGFLGSLLIEKIGRSCPDFGKIYLLLRSKRGLTPSERLDKLFDDEIFNRLKKENPGFRSRVFLMEGDLNEPQCGLSQENLNIIRDEVNIIYHNAACLRMTEPLKNAYHMNVRATKDLLDLGTEMKHLKAFIYTSTAYSNCFRPDISETFYSTTYNWENLRDLVERMPEEDLDYFTPKLVGPWVNTYAFTKAIAEDMIKSYVGRIPVAIARPSIVIGCVEEPLKCWINNVYGSVGVSAGACVGIIRVWYADYDKVADIIPADYVVNTMISIASQLDDNQQGKVHLEPPIFNIVSSPKAPTTWGEHMRDSFIPAKKSKITTRKSIGEFAFVLVRKKWLFSVLFIILHLSQGLLVDTLLYLNGKSPQLVKGYIKIMRFNMQLSFFCEREWTYEQPNVDAMLERMSEVDKRLFPFDMTSFNWKKYHECSTRAIFKYIVKSKDCENQKPAHDHYRRFLTVRQYIVRAVKIVVVYGVLKMSQTGLNNMMLFLSRDVQGK
uniref:Fatty acyl-CoA reductase n=1 Tax=Lygus hesperus TaxID=30085 RepID=A0A0A9WBK2_LYGHE